MNRTVSGGRVRALGMYLIFVATASVAQTPEEILERSRLPSAGMLNAYGKPQHESSLRYSDSVDPFSGNLSAQVRGITVPGNGGFDINIDWVYRMSGLGNTGAAQVAPSASAVFDDAARNPGAWSLSLAPRLVYHSTDTNFRFCNPSATPASSGRNRHGIYGKAVLELPNGGADSIYYSEPRVFLTAGRWRVTCDAAGSPIAQSPDGVTYKLTVQTTYYDHERARNVVILDTSRATDRNGNFYDIAYTTITARSCGALGAASATQALPVPSTITASDGRSVSLSYDTGDGTSACDEGRRGPRLTTITTNGHTWRFEYHPSANRSVPRPGGITLRYRVSAQLARVILPDNTVYQFDYRDVCPTSSSTQIIFRCGQATLSKVTFPGGGHVGYDYRESFDIESGYSRFLGCDDYEEGGCTWGTIPSDAYVDTWDAVLEQSSNVFSQPDVMRRYTSDGGEWVYSYDRSVNRDASAGQYDITTVDGPTGRTTHRFYGLGYFTPAALGSYSRWGNVCNPNSHRTPEIPPSFCQTASSSGYPGAWMVGLPFDIQKGSDYTETFAWTSQVLTANDWLAVSGRVRLADGAQVLVPLLQEKTITVNGAAHRTTYSDFDAYGNPARIVEAGPNGGNRTTDRTYWTDASRWIIQQLRNETSEGTSIERTFDSLGRLRSITRNAVATSYTYDGEGNIETATFPRGLQHSFSNYKRGIAQDETQPEGVSIHRVVADTGDILSIRDGEGNTRSFTYDGLGRTRSITHPQGNAVSITYTATTRTTTRGDLKEIITYDGLGRMSRAELGGVVTTYGYDTSGRKSFESNPGETIGTSYEYDILDRIKKVTNADRTIKSFHYSSSAVSITDERSKVTTRKFRAYGDPAVQFLVEVTAPDAAANISIVRNAFGAIRFITQAGITREFGYDSRQYLTSEIHSETGTTVYGRDDAGNMISRSVGGAAATSFGYDGHNRLRTTTYPGGEVASLTYYRTHRLKQAQSVAGTRNFTYDLNSNLTRESITADDVTLAVDYRYNDNDQLSGMRYPISLQEVGYFPDALGRPTRVSGNGATGYVSSVGYFPSGQIAHIYYANGTDSHYGQNSRLWPGFFSSRAAGLWRIVSTYEYDGVGNITSIQDTADASYNRSMTYDDINRLKTVSGPWGSGTLDYDGRGNLMRQQYGQSVLSYAYDTSNRLSQVSGARSTSYTYDAAGNVATGAGHVFTFDAGSHLRCVDCTNTQSRIEYGYDALGTRLWTLKSGQKTYELYGSNGDLLAEYTPSVRGRLLEYIYLGGKRIAQRAFDSGYPTTIIPARTQLNTSGHGVVLTVRISGLHPGGSVVFSENGEFVGFANVIDGEATIIIEGMSLGSHTITATYSGDGTHAQTTTTFTVQVRDLAWLPVVIDLLLSE